MYYIKLLLTKNFMLSYKNWNKLLMERKKLHYIQKQAK